MGPSMAALTSRLKHFQIAFISGGCGAMYEIQIESEEFKEKRTVQQHQMVNQVSRGNNAPLPPSPASATACQVGMVFYR